MRASDLHRYEQKLHACKSRLMGGENYDAGRQKGADSADSAAYETLDDVEAKLEQGQGRTLALVQYALAKINGEVRGAAFGMCERCENGIPKQRLDHVPYAQYCATCQEKEESDENGQVLMEHSHPDPDWADRQIQMFHSKI